MYLNTGASQGRDALHRFSTPVRAREALVQMTESGNVLLVSLLLLEVTRAGLISFISNSGLNNHGVITPSSKIRIPKTERNPKAQIRHDMSVSRRDAGIEAELSTTAATPCIWHSAQLTSCLASIGK